MGNMLRKKCSKQVEEPKFRHVVPNHLVPDDVEHRQHPNRSYHSNRIKTTKYTVWSFIPKNLFEQFHRFANLYFLFIVLLNWVPQINAFAKEVAMIPVILVLAVTAIKDGFEDYRRYQSDNKINHLPCRVYSRKDRRYNRREWQDITCGDIIHLSCNEVIPADIVLLRTSDMSGLCHIDNSNIDGESNLKQRHVVKSLRQGDEFHPTLFTHTIECELPNLEVYKFHGAMLTPLNERIPITKNNILLRGCILRNTDFVEGIVVYAGHETKALLNNRGHRYKRSKVERQINRDVIWCVILLLLMCFMSALGTGLWNANLPGNMLAPFIPYESLSEFSASYQGFIRFWTYVILYQVVIPLSLYVTIELVKMGQIYLINHDLNLYHPETDKSVECRALNITEDLGQIEYVFSDKTGTLTENEMIFQCCAIGGVDYSSQSVIPTPVSPVSRGAVGFDNVKDDGFVKLNLAAAPTTGIHMDVFTPEPTLKQIVTSMMLTDVPVDIPVQIQRIWEFFILLTVCNTVVVSLHGHQDKMDATGYIHGDRTVKFKSTSSPACSSTPDEQSTARSLSPTTSQVSKKMIGVKSLFRKQGHKLKTFFFSTSSSPILTDNELEHDPGSGSEEDEIDDDSEVTDTDMSMMSENSLRTKYEAESPDELALVQAACSYGCRLLQRTPDQVTLWLPREGEVNVRILHILHFDAERKRMSVIVQHPAGQIILYCKGADSAIIPQVRSPRDGDDEARRIVSETQLSVTQYAKKGLRTLCMARKVLDLSEYQKWLESHREAESSVEHRERKLHESACKIENNLELLGVTGMEDRLQEGVPETISSLREAGICIWVLTGDKQETAVNIAYSCKLISFDQEMIILNAKNLHMTQELLESKLEYMDILYGCTASSSSHNSQEDVVTSSRERRNQGDARNVALVIDGKTLGFIQQNTVCRDTFLQLAQQCNSVLCCRATPAQKAYMVKLVQEKLHKLTLAIGDGANDVNMIQTADIGIGISGKEGMQAVMASDFALVRFYFLKRLLLVHGHWCYDRLARMTLYMFFKNTVFVLLLLWFQIYSGYSGGAMVDDLNLILFNLLYTALPPIVFGILDKDVPAGLLMTRPTLYRQGIIGLAYKRYSYFICILEAIWQSLAQFYVPYLAYRDSTAGLWEFGLTSLAGCVWATLLHLCMETRCWNVFHVSVIVMSLLLFYSFNVVYSIVVVVGSPPANPYCVYIHTLTSPIHWLSIILTVIIALAPRFLLRSLEGTFHPSATVLSRQKLNSYPTYSEQKEFATWRAIRARSHDFEHLQEEDVQSPRTAGHRSVTHKRPSSAVC